MGCDIHIFVEVRKKGNWKVSNKEHFSLSDWEKDYEKKEKTNSPFDWRGYKMFSVLAGVRGNGSVKPIKKPLYEIPDDSSDKVKISWENWSGDGHSASSLTARELIEFDYSQDLINGNDDVSTNSRRVILGKTINPEDNYDKICNDYYEFLGGPDSMFFTHVKELAELGDLDDVRVVFWFDN